MSKEQSRKRYEEAKERVFRDVLQTIRWHDSEGNSRSDYALNLDDCESLTECYERLSPAQREHFVDRIRKPAMNVHFVSGKSWKEADIEILEKLERGEKLKFSDRHKRSFE